MSSIHAWIDAFFDCLYIEYSFGNYRFTLMDVFTCGLILSLCGYFIGKIYYFLNNRR